MLKKRDLARIIHDRFRLRGGAKIPIYLGGWMVDYVFEAIKIGLMEDDVVEIQGCAVFTRTHVPEHDKRLPDDTYVTIPAKSKIRIEARPPFVRDVDKGVIKGVKEEDVD